VSWDFEVRNLVAAEFYDSIRSQTLTGRQLHPGTPLLPVVHLEYQDLYFGNVRVSMKTPQSLG
jgi:hypothetical protein